MVAMLSRFWALQRRDMAIHDRLSICFPLLKSKRQAGDSLLSWANVPG
jgi:hypothetical protein